MADELKNVEDVNACAALALCQTCGGFIVLCRLADVELRHASMGKDPSEARYASTPGRDESA